MWLHMVVSPPGSLPHDPPFFHITSRHDRGWVVVVWYLPLWRSGGLGSRDYLKVPLGEVAGLVGLVGAAFSVVVPIPVTHSCAGGCLP